MEINCLFHTWKLECILISIKSSIPQCTIKKSTNSLQNYQLLYGSENRKGIGSSVTIFVIQYSFWPTTPLRNIVFFWKKNNQWDRKILSHPWKRRLVFIKMLIIFSAKNSQFDNNFTFIRMWINIGSLVIINFGTEPLLYNFNN